VKTGLDFGEFCGLDFTRRIWTPLPEVVANDNVRYQIHDPARSVSRSMSALGLIHSQNFDSTINGARHYYSHTKLQSKLVIGLPMYLSLFGICGQGSDRVGAHSCSALGPHLCR
jgi:hypothetical protein